MANNNKKQKRRPKQYWLLGLIFVPVAQAAAQDLTHTSPAAASAQRKLTARPIIPDEVLTGLYPSIDVVVRHHDNVFRVPDSEKESDWVISIRPRVVYRTPVGRHQAQVRYSANVIRHDKFSSEDVTDQSLDAALKLDVTEKLDVNLFADYNESHEGRGTSVSRLRPDDEIFDSDQGPDEFELTRYGGQITYGRRESKIQVEIGAAQSEWRFTNNNQEGRDRDEDQFHATLYYNIGARTSAFLRSTFDDIDYRSPVSDLDNEEIGYFLGLRWEASAATTGEVGVGRLEKEFDVSARDDEDTSSYFARIIWKAKPFSVVSLHASKTLEETTDLNSDFIDSRLVGMSWDHWLTDRLAFFLYANATRDKFESGRTDRFKDYGAGIEYAFRSWLILGLHYGVFERNSNQVDADFEDNVFSALLRFRTVIDRDQL